MKIMYFIHALDIGGAEMICTRYLVELKNRNIDVVLVVIAHRKTFLEEELKKIGVRIISIHPLKHKNIVCVLINNLYCRCISLKSWWNKLIDEEKPDVIHIHTSQLNYFAPDIFPPDKMIYTFHGHVDRYMILMKEKGRRYMYRYAKGGMKFFALSTKMNEDIKDTLSTRNVVYMPNGLNLSGIKSSAYCRKKVLSILGIPNDSFILGHVARFHEVKNQERTVKIFQEVLKIKENSYLLFIGNYKNKWGASVRKLVLELGINDRVKFLGVRDDATKIMPTFNAMVLPSFTESFSLAMVEAQANNVRSVASMAVPETVICNDNCFRLSLEESDEKWAYYLTGDFKEKHEYRIEDFEMNNVVDRMIDEYKKSARI